MKCNLVSSSSLQCNRAVAPHGHLSIFGIVFIFNLICIKNWFFYTRKYVVYKFYAHHLILCCLIAVIPVSYITCIDQVPDPLRGIRVDFVVIRFHTFFC